MQKVVVINKKEGETPLEAVSLFRKKHKEYKDTSMTYAGRLDPMASGLLIILAGEECKNKEKYLKLDKEYEFEVLFGFATDTYDILGKVTARQVDTRLDKKELETKIKENLKYFKGKLVQKYPVYSSKTVKGKPLFMYGREGKDVEIPEREINIRRLKFLKLRKINSDNLLKNIEKRILKVKGDFRQEEILKKWQEALVVGSNPYYYFIASFKIKCSSGTYVRGIANSLGEKILTKTLAYSIKRTKIGKYVIL